jgi:prepilin-type N-terminal cleavage/methylation domain-containing protein
MRKAEGGFSLVEMLVAVTVTLIISGAVYGLIASGQNSFRREPEMADRQQNIRIAMALIEQDIESGGAGLPVTTQVFSPALNGVGVQGTIGTPGQAARNGDPSINTDALEVVSTEDTCPALRVCNRAGAILQTREPVPTCMPGAPAPGSPGLVAIADINTFVVQPVVAGAAAACPGAVGFTGDIAQNGSLTLGAALPPWLGVAPAPLSAAAQAPAAPNNFLYTARISRYRIGPSGEALEALANEPALWRSSTGIYTTAGAAVVEPGQPGFNPAAPGPWQLVARGIEDLQVEYLYRNADTTLVWVNLPRVVVLNDFTTVARAARVTLSARAVAVNVQGQMPAGAGSGGRAAIRGQLARVVAPRASLMALQINYQLR